MIYKRKNNTKPAPVMEDPSMSSIASGTSEFDNIGYLMYISTYIGGKYIDDGLLSINNKSKNKELLYRYDDCINLLQMEEQLVQKTNSIIYQIREDENGQPQPNLAEDWGVLTARYLALHSRIVPKIGENIENEEMSNILKEKKDSNLTMLRIIRAICNHVNNKMGNGGELSKILGEGYKENTEEDN